MELPIARLRKAREKCPDKLRIGKFISDLISDKWDKGDHSSKIRVSTFDNSISNITGRSKYHWEDICHETGWHIRIRPVGTGRKNYYVFTERNK